jgi:hypothetical protein
MGDLLIERDRARGCILLPVGVKRRGPQQLHGAPPDSDQKYGGVRLRSPQEPVGHANWLQKLSFSFLPCVSMRSRHIAIADTAARPSQGRRSTKVIIIVPVS